MVGSANRTLTFCVARCMEKPVDSSAMAPVSFQDCYYSGESSITARVDQTCFPRNKPPREGRTLGLTQDGPDDQGIYTTRIGLMSARVATPEPSKEPVCGEEVLVSNPGWCKFRLPERNWT
jgi:hypothetical protein